jgi:hypothetical protein
VSDPTILIVPPQNLSAKDKRELAKAGCIVIEMDDPQQARLIRAHAEISSTEMLAAAAKGLEQSSSAREAFANAIIAVLKTKATPDDPSSP